MGFIGIDRGLREHWIYQDAEYLKVWMEMLFLARFSEEPHNELIDGEIITVNYSEFIYGRIKWSDRLKVTEQRLRTLIKKLKTEKMIEVVSEHRKCTLYRMTNYSKFNQQTNQQIDHIQQVISDYANHQSDQQPTSSQPAANQQLTTKEESNKVNKVKKVKEEVIKYPADSLYFKMSDYFYKKICEWTDKVDQPNYEKWSDDFRKLVEIDLKDKDIVRNVIDWVTKDAFWQTNILSPDKLRKQFVKLQVQMERPSQSNVKQFRNQNSSCYSNKQSIPIIQNTSLSRPSEEEYEMMRERARKMDEKFNKQVPS